MALREIIEIDEAKCTGCGDCETGCPEGALRVIDGKARLVGESLCDGLGACIGNCPYGAITVTRREAEGYDEAKVLDGMVKLGPEVLRAHLDHLRKHGQEPYLRQARVHLAGKGIPFPEASSSGACVEGRALEGGCPGSRQRRFVPAPAAAAGEAARTSTLSHWPIQLHLINPRAPHYLGTKLLVAADCTAFSLGSFHGELLSGKSIVIACPKLDQARELYLDKLAVLLDIAASVEVAIMEVPCCSGLLKLVLDARERTAARPSVVAITIGIGGGILGRRAH
jgi:NAD-dependent dihydropyrimidine dehydrogenase PreA subunit